MQFGYGGYEGIGWRGPDTGDFCEGDEEVMGFLYILNLTPGGYIIIVFTYDKAALFKI